MINYYPSGARLQAELRKQLGIDCGVSGPDAAGTFVVHYPPGTPQSVQDQGNAIAATWPATDYRSRLMWDIKEQLQQLPAEQLQKIYGDLWTQTWPPKLVKTEGQNSSGIFASYAVWTFGGTTPGDADILRLYGSAMYIQDNPAYAINPPFDTTINVPGWEPVP